MTNVLMIYPVVPLTYWSFDHVFKFNGKKAFMPPLGLLTVAAMLPENWNIRLIDMNVETLSDDELQRADLVMLSSMIVQKDSFQQIVERAKRKGVKIAAGGPYPTSCHKQIKNVDYFILNEAESTLHEFVRDFEEGKARPVYESADKPDLAVTPIPRFDLIDVHAYSSMALQSSRGCPFHCEFCDIIELFGTIPRYKKCSQLLDEFDALYDTGYRGALFIVDDNFIGNIGKVKALLREIVLWQMEHAYPFGLYTEASINLAEDEELLEMMSDAGFDTVFIGIETPDTEILGHAGKTQNTRRNLLESVRTIQSKGIEVMGGFILGFDNESDDIFQRQCTFIDQAAIPVAMIGLLIALPQTQLYRRLEAEGRILEETNGNNTHQLDMNFITTMPHDEVVDGYKHVIRELYQPSHYFSRAMKMISRTGSTPNVPKKIRSQDIKTFLRSLLLQSFSRYGFSYLKFMLRVILFHRAHLYRAVALSVKGDHFFRISRDIILLARTRRKVSKTSLFFENKLQSLVDKWGKTDKTRIAAGQLRALAEKKIRYLIHRTPGRISEQAAVYYSRTLAQIDTIYKHFALTLESNSD